MRKWAGWQPFGVEEGLFIGAGRSWKIWNGITDLADGRIFTDGLSMCLSLTVLFGTN